MPQETPSLASFLADLFQQGNVLVKNRLAPFSEEELTEAKLLLERIHEVEQLNTPREAINFDPAAALWAAQFLYRAIQIALLRDCEEDMIRKELRLYPGTINPASICSADLCLRYLKDLFKLTKGLAPGDVLLAFLSKVALQWPYSAIGWAPLPNKEQLFDILKHEGLRLLFLERLIDEHAFQDIERLQLSPWIHALTGLYPDQLLPNLINPLRNENDDTTN